MASTKKADLFGDTDSSDGEVGAKKPAAASPTRTKIAESSDEDEAPTKPEAPTAASAEGAVEDKAKEAKPPTDGPEKAVAEPPKVDENKEDVAASGGAAKEKGNEDEPTAEAAGKEASTPTNNATLFGDDDDSEDDAGEDAEKKEDGGAKEEDPEDKEAGTPNNAVLFGDEDSSEDDEFDGGDDIVGRSGDGAKKKPAAKPTEGMSMNERLGLDSDGEEEGAKPDEEEKKEDEPPKYVPPRRMELQDLSLGDDTRNLNGSSKADVTYHMVKLPNLVGIQPAPYDPKTHDMEGEEEEYKGHVHNMIRWRYKTDDNGEYLRDEKGQPIRESNTRLVKWSDGSYTLHVGKEVLEIDNLNSSVPVDHADPSIAGFAGSNGYVYVSQQASVRPPTKRMTEGPPTEGKADFTDDEETGEAEPAGTVLECVGPIASRFGLRPSSLTSEAHRTLKLAVQKRNVRRARIAEYVTEVDPEKEKQERIRGKDDLAKSTARKGGARRSGGGGRRRGMNASYLEEDEEDYDGVNLGRLKKQTMRQDYDSEEEEMDFGESEDSDSEEGEEEWQKQKKRKRGALAAAKAAHEKAKAKEESESEGELVFGDDDEDDEEEVGPSKKAKVGGSANKAVLDDDDDE
ncbi:hypothetical protein ACHAXT_006236 [Thalassiosira profunda]